MFLRWLQLFFCLSLVACFGGVDKRGSVLGYRNGVVQTEGGAFRIGDPGPDWMLKKYRFRALFFAHRTQSATMTVDAFCKGAFDDAGLDTLTSQLTYGMTNLQQKRQTRTRLEGRDALRTYVTGKVDGASVSMDMVVLKMNECIFDFVYITLPHQHEVYVKDFEKLIYGFEYISGPGMD